MLRCPEFLSGLLLLIPALLAAPQAHADKVHNVLETPASSDMQVGVGLTGMSRQDRRYATSFTTGTNGNPAGNGWTLNHVFGKFAAKTGAPSGFRASIFTDSNGSPGTERVQLSGSAPDTAGDKLFSCSGANCALTDNTTYWLVFAAPDGDLNSDNYYAWRNTTSDNQTRVPWNNGWSIGNSHKYDLEETGSWTAGGAAVSGLMEVDFTAVAPTLSPSNYGQTTVTLTIAGYSGTWYYKADGTDGVCSAAVTGTTANVANLVAGRNYKFRAFNDSACAAQIAVTTAFDLIPPDPANLRVTAGVESLTLNWNASTGASSYEARWRLSGSTGSYTPRQSISGTSTTISSLTGGTTYEVGVRAVGVGPSSWTGATGTPASPVTLTASNVRKTTATLTIANYTGTNWYYKYTTPTGGTCSAAQTGTTASLTTLTANTAYTFKAYSDSGCATEVTSASTDADFTTASGVSLRANNITNTSFRLTAYDISSYPSLRFKRVSPTAGVCRFRTTNSAAVAGWDIGSLSPATTYTYELYAPQACQSNTKIADVTFTTLATLAASAVKETTATLTITGRTTAWWYQGNQAGAQCKSVAASTSTASLTALTGGTSYTYKAYGAAGCNAADLISTNATFSTVGLSAESLAQAGATLTIANWTQAWWYKGSQTGAQCTSVAANTTTASLALAAGTSYTYTAYSASGCATANKIADVAFSTPAAVALAASAVKETTATLTLASWTKAWWYKGNQTGAQCMSVAANTTTASLTGLTGGTSYTYKAYSKTGCNAADLISTDAAFSTVGLTTAFLTQRTATLTLANWNAAWWHKRTSPAGGTCIPVAANIVTATMTGLTAGTTYGWTVYGAAGCTATNKIADAAFTTADAAAPPAPSGLTVAAGNKQVALSWTSGGDGGAALTKWQYVKKVGTGNFETTWTDMTGSGASTTSHTVTGLTNGTAYKFKVRAVNSVGNGAESAESSAVTPALSGVCGRTAEVRDAIVNEFTGKTCAQVTATDLDDITSLIIQNKSTLTSLRAGDFDGLTELTSLLIGSNGLTSLPARIFDDLTALELLHLNVNSLASLPAGVFDKLTALTSLRLDNNSLTTLPAGAFDKLTALTSLRLQNNSLTTLPAGIFDKATALTSIYLNDNSLTSLRAGVFDKLTSLSSLRLNNNSSLACLPFIPSSVSSPLLDTRTYSACGAGVTMGSAGVTVGPGVASTYTVVLDAYPQGNVTVTPVSSATGTATVSGSLTFTQSNWSTAQSITVTGVAAGSTTVSHTVSGGGYGSATAADVAVTVTAASLAASAITQTGATLTLSGYTGNWYYKYTSPTGGTCSTVQIGTTVSIGNLTKGTTYIFTAYSDSACSTAFTVAPAFTAATKPSAPATPAATWGNGSVTLTWTAPDNGGSPITDYDYHTRNQTDGGGWTEYEANNTSTATTKTLNLTNGKTWRLRVRAGNVVGDSNWSWPFVEVRVGSPALVAAPTLVSLGGGKFNVLWTAPSGNGSVVTGYSIWHKQGEGAWTEVTGIAGSATSHTLTLTAGHPYAIGVEAHNARGGSNPSIDEFGGATTSVISEATLMASAVTHEVAVLTMGNHTGSWYYKYTVPSGGVCSALQSGTSADVTGLAGNTSYTYKAYSDSTCMTELAAAAPFLTKPAKPDKPTATGGVGSGKLELSSSVAGGSSALTKWQYTKDNGTTWSDISVTWSWTTRLIHVVTGLTDGTNYTFQVRAVNDTGAGPASEASEPAQSTSTAPDPVTAVTVLHNGSSLAVSWWPAAARADSYHVTYSDNNGTSWQLAALEHTGTSLTIHGVDNSKTYIVGVRAKNAAGYSGWTNSGAVTSPAPDPVASVTLVHQGNSLDVTWPAAARAASYHVTYTDDNAISWQLAALEHAGTSLTINSVDSSKTYIVGVRAKNAGGSSGWTNSAAATFAVPDPVASVTVVHNGSSLSVTWPAAARANSYHVTYTGDNAISWQLGALAHSGTSLTISGVDSSKTYMVAVRAKNAAGYSGWVNSAPAAPPALSVADATAVEPGVGQSANLDFMVTLNRAASGTVTVDYATSDGTATAGADYTAASGTLTFQPGDTSKTVAVVVLNDSHNEGSETMTLTLSNATGAVIDSNAAQASGTITNKDPVPQAWISRFGRTVADQVLDAVDIRMGSTPTPGLGVTLAGERLDWWADSDEGQPMAQQAVAQLAQWLTVGSGDNGDLAVRTVTGSELLADSSFALSSRTAGGALLSFWGRGAVTSFEGREGELSLDGEVTTWMLGTDWSWGQWPDGQGVTRHSTAGLLLSRSRADGGYAGTGSGTDNRFSGDVVSTLTGVFPWGRYRFTDRLEAWGAVGYGQGELEVTPKLSTGQDGATLTTDLNLWLAAGGLRGTLLDGGNDGITLTGKTDVMAVVTSSAQVTGQDGNLAAAEATVTRLRLGLEAQRPFSFGEPDAAARATLTPSLELGLRHDGGDAETGFGLDLGGGFTLSHPARGLQAELRGRGLLTHAAEGFRDQGFSGSLSWQQRPDSDLGAMLSLSQTMGGSSSGGADALLSRVNLEGLAASDDEGNGLTHQRLDLQLSYGFLALGDHFTLTPELGLGLYDRGRDYRIGWRLTRLAEMGAFDFSFDVTRQEGANNDGTAPEHGVQLEWNTRF